MATKGSWLALVLAMGLAATACGEQKAEAPASATAQPAQPAPTPPEPPPAQRDELIRQTAAFLKSWDKRKERFLESYRTDFERALSRMGWFRQLSTRAYEARGFASLIFSDGQNLRPAAHTMIATAEEVEVHGLDKSSYEPEVLKGLLQKVVDKQEDYAAAIVAPEDPLTNTMWAVLERLHTSLDVGELAIRVALEEVELNDEHVPLLDEARTRLDALFQAKTSLNDVLRDLDLGLLQRFFRYAYDMRFARRLHPFDADADDGAGVERAAEQLFALFSSTDFGALTEVLTGECAVGGSSSLNRLASLFNNEILNPRAFDPSLPRELDALAQRCLAPNPAERLESAQSFVDELGRHLAGVPLESYAYGLHERAFKAFRRKPGLFISVVLGLVAICVVGIFDRVHLDAARSLAEEHAARAQQERQVAERQRQAAVAQREVAEAWDDGYALHAPVGSFHANAFGVHDMAGNVWEWCEDDAFPDYSDGPLTQLPRQGGSQGKRVVRGGSWFFPAFYQRSANRYSRPPSYSNEHGGLRLVWNLEGKR